MLALLVLVMLLVLLMLVLLVLVLLVLLLHAGAGAGAGAVISLRSDHVCNAAFWFRNQCNRLAKHTTLFYVLSCIPLLLLPLNEPVAADWIPCSCLS